MIDVCLDFLNSKFTYKWIFN